MKKLLHISIAVVILSLISLCAEAQIRAKPKDAKTGVVKKPTDMISLLQGKWVSLDDAESFIVFKNYQQIDLYGKEVLTTAAFNFYNGCPTTFSANDAKAKKGTHLVVALGETDFLCFQVVSLTAKQLTINYTSRGDTLRYRKIIK